jgi:superoxide dismutase, Fe-Mn family
MSTISRRDVLGSAAMVGGWLMFGAGQALGQETKPAAGGVGGGAGGAAGPYQLPPLPYGYADLEPFIDSQTLKLHHDVHHAGYVNGANAAVAELERIRQTGGDALQQVRAVTMNLAFNLSGNLLHDLYWKSMKKGGGGDPAAGSTARDLLMRDFGSLDAFRANLGAVATQVQGSGWAVLTYEPLAQRLYVLQAEKHENTGMWGTVPLLALDVWEHAYYLKYQNKRTEYIKAFMELINWETVEERLKMAQKPV